MNDIGVEIDELLKAIADVAGAITSIIRKIVESIDYKAIQRIAKIMEYETIRNEVRISRTNGRIKHLALYAKKKRVRKKNMNRIRRLL